MTDACFLVAAHSLLAQLVYRVLGGFMASCGAMAPQIAIKQYDVKKTNS